MQCHGCKITLYLQPEKISVHCNSILMADSQLMLRVWRGAAAAGWCLVSWSLELQTKLRNQRAALRIYANQMSVPCDLCTYVLYCELTPVQHSFKPGEGPPSRGISSRTFAWSSIDHSDEPWEPLHCSRRILQIIASWTVCNYNLDNSSGPGKNWSRFNCPHLLRCRLWSWHQTVPTHFFGHALLIRGAQ